MNNMVVVARDCASFYAPAEQADIWRDAGYEVCRLVAVPTTERLQHQPEETAGQSTKLMAPPPELEVFDEAV